MHSPETDSPAQAAAERQFVTFEVAGEMFAVPMGPVQEIIRVPDVARLPLAPPALDGLANLRGRVLPIVNLRRLFNTAPRANDDATRALVIHLGQPLGFVVDRVASVVNVEPGEIEPATAVHSLVQADCLTGVINRPAADGGRQLLLVLDFQRLVAGQFTALRRTPDGSPGGDATTATTTDTGLHGAGPAPGEPAASDELRLVSFTVQAQEYAIAITSVQEIVQLPASITGVPNAPPHVLGLVSLRQRLLPLVSLRCLFGLPPVPASEQQRIVVVALPGGAQVGLETDTVKEVLGVPRSQAEPVPGALARSAQLQEFEAICRLDGGKRLVSVLSAERLLGLPEIRAALDAGAALAQPGQHTTQAAEAGTQQDTPMHTEHTSPAGQADDGDTQVVIFRLGAEEFGVPIMSVQEIVRVPEALTRVPNTPRFVEGVINLRGTVLPVIDQRTRLGLPAIERHDGQRIMVYMLGTQRTGFIVDAVAEVLRIGRAQVEAAPQLGSGHNRLITRVAKLDGDRRLVMLIDPAQLLAADDSPALDGLATPAPLQPDGDAPDLHLPLARAA